MIGDTDRFAELFKKYRLKAEIPTFAELGRLLAEKGFIYEDSIFSHWQKGARIPNRPTLIKLLEIFSKRQGIKSISQVNEFLESAGEGYLTATETEKISLDSSESIPFQVPNQIDNFTGREALIKRITKDIEGKVILIHGPAGVGKSALAIKIGHLIKDKFKDGVLWYRLDTSDVMDIFLSIAFAFGMDIAHIQDKEIRASFVRSLLAKKNVLLIFDNAEPNTDIRLLLTNAKNCSVIITSRNTTLSIPVAHESIFLDTFTIFETLLLFKTILGERYMMKNKNLILKLADQVGFLPLALHIFAKELKKGSVTIPDLIEEIKEDLLSLQELSYEDKNLHLAISFSYELLDVKTKKIFLSLAVFEGKDFSQEAVAYINELSTAQAKKFLNNLENISLIEQSAKHHYRIHPMIKMFLREKFDNPPLFLKAAKYYEEFLGHFDKAFLKSYPNIKQESDNVIYIFKKCYELHYWDEVITLWNPLEKLLYATHQLSKMRYLFQIVKGQKTGINIFQKIIIICFGLLVISWVLLYLNGLKVGFWNYLWNFSISFFLLPGGILGLFIAKSWGLLSSSVGKAVLFLSGGLLAWGAGNTIWAYYNFFGGVVVPYPSFADLGFIVSYPLWAIGMMYLPHAIGGKFSFRKKYRIILFLIPLFVLALSYYLMVFITKSPVIFVPSASFLKLFFDIAYPTGDVVILTIALILGVSFKFFGGKYKLSIYSILLGFCFLYIADFLFSYTTTANSYYNGSITDLLFTVGLSLLTLGVLGFYIRFEKKL